MQGIGPGSILGGRYTADRRTAQYTGAERWTGRDTTLDRAVVLFTVPRSHPNVDAVLDAARRSAGLDNARLSRILDVGTDDDLAYVVEEALDGAHSLAAILAAGPLPAPEVRRIAGETALVLDLARHRGLHHQRLTPDLVLRTADGDIKVRGLATMAALAGVDDVDDQIAARADAMAVVALAYAGFTAHWPLDGHGGGLPPAPRVAAHVAAPSEIAVGVPADLDALCRLTFANDQGPVTPGDFARQIAPWSPIPVLLPSLDPPEQSELSHSDLPHSGGSAKRASAPPQVARAGMVPDESSGPPDEEIAEDEGPDPRDRQADSDESSSTASPTHSRALGPSESGTAAVPVARRVPARPGTVPAQGGTPSKPAAPPRSAPPRPAGSTPATTTPAGPSPLAAMTAATTAAIGSASAATVSAARTVSGRLNEWSAATRDRARDAVDDVRSRREQAAATRGAPFTQVERDADDDSRPAGGRPRMMGAVAPGVRDRERDVLEPPVPLLPASSAEPLTRDQSRMAIGIVVGFLILALVFAFWGLSRIPSLPALGSGDGATPAVTAPATADGDAATTDTDGDGTPDAPAQAVPLTFTAAIDYDPLGDGAERPEDLPRILDGDDSSAWGSEGYRSESFSNLKSGVGVILDLGETSSISEVTLVLPSESTGTLYVTDDAEYANDGKALADDLAGAGTFTGSGTVTTELAEGASGRYVIVWFTEISTGGEQWYRARLAGASATS